MPERRDSIIRPADSDISADYRVVGEEPDSRPFLGSGWREPIIRWGNLWTLVWVVGALFVMRWIIAWMLGPVFLAIHPAFSSLFR